MPPRQRDTGADAGWMSIGALSRATGVAIETLRTWERRYGVPSPTRKPSGHRLYPAAAVEHLRRVEMLLNRGHRPAEVLTLSLPELDRMLSVSEARAVPARPRATAPQGTGAAPALEPLVAATRDMDGGRLARELRTQWSRLGPLRFLEECAGPFMRAVGEGWSAGELDVRHEHFASACLSDVLREVRGPFADRADGPVVAVAALEGDLHEGGILMASVLMSVRGWRVIYVGPNTPPAELASLARERTLDAVALGLSAAVPKARAARAVRTVRTSLPRRVALWTGGTGAPGGIRGVEHFPTLASLDARLALPA